MSGWTLPSISRRPVPAGRALVGARRHGVRRDQVGEVDVGPVEVVAGREPGLEDQHGRGGLGEDHALGLHPHGPGRAHGVHPRVRAAGVDEDLLVLLEPGVEGGPLEADGVVEARRPSPHRGPWPRRAGRTSPTRRPKSLHVATRGLLGGALVDEHVRLHVGQRDVELREGRATPTRSGRGSCRRWRGRRGRPGPAGGPARCGWPERAGRGSRSPACPPRASQHSARP